ncbi:hypothetical protein NBG4_1180005 [Candidatus Sulfobium mesophilum]|uniref:Uncharacterized protein n=1 Tax=Candidatus Sulfobium mesophilum TaxID=2016548 RepID=A0A2U3QEN8_9BACT|nr:hypothetical protein NBG4_1180005 [Candidatus Sulfobium mesophilum]
MYGYNNYLSKGDDVMDVLYLAITAGLFVLTGLFMRLLEKV